MNSVQWRDRRFVIVLHWKDRILEHYEQCAVKRQEVRDSVALKGQDTRTLWTVGSVKRQKVQFVGTNRHFTFSFNKIQSQIYRTQFGMWNEQCKCQVVFSTYCTVVQYAKQYLKAGTFPLDIRQGEPPPEAKKYVQKRHTRTYLMDCS